MTQSNPYLINWKNSIALNELPEINLEISRLSKIAGEIQMQERLQEKKRLEQCKSWFESLKTTNNLELISDIVFDFIDPKGLKYHAVVAREVLKNPFLLEEQLMKMVEICCAPVCSDNYKITIDKTFLNYVIKSHNLSFNLAKRIYDFGKIANIWECNFSNPDDAKCFADYFFEQEKEKYLKKLDNFKLN